MVLKTGVIDHSQMGDANASEPTVQPVYGQPMFGAYPVSAALNSVLFVSYAHLDEEQEGKFKGYGLRKRGVAVKDCRTVKKNDIKLNNETPRVEVDPERQYFTVPPLVL